MARKEKRYFHIITVLLCLMFICADVLIMEDDARASRDFGAVTTATNLRFNIFAVDDTGAVGIPDSGHLIVQYQGEVTANAASYLYRWATAGATDAIIDSLRYAGYTRYYFIDQVADIDNGEGTGLYTGIVSLFTDGQAHDNDFSFHLVDTPYNNAITNAASALNPTTAGRKLDVTATGEAGIDLDNTIGTLSDAEIADITVGSVTGAVGSVTGSVGSVTGAVGSVTGAVGSVTGNVGGSVASVTGAVGSVTAGVTVTTNNDKTGYALTQTFPTNFSDLAITVTTGKVTVGTNDDKTGYVLTQTFPTNFADLLIAVTTGYITVGTNNDKSDYSLSSTQTFNVTGDRTGNVSGSVGSVTGAVGSVTGSVASVTGAVGSVTGNVGGSVASVTGAVGSVTAEVDADVTAISGDAAAADSLEADLDGYGDTQLTHREKLFTHVMDSIQAILDSIQNLATLNELTDSIAISGRDTKTERAADRDTIWILDGVDTLGGIELFHVGGAVGDPPDSTKKITTW